MIHRKIKYIIIIETNSLQVKFGIVVLENDVFQLGNLFFDSLNMQLIYDNEIIKFRPQFAKLLKEFVQAPNCYLKSEYIYMIIWDSSAEYKIDGRLQKLISELRNFFQSYTPQIRIEFESNGYRLYVEE